MDCDLFLLSSRWGVIGSARGCCCVVFLSSPIHWLLCLELLVRSDQSLAGWWSGDRLWIPLKRAGPVLALSGSGGFVVTGAIGDSDRGFCVLRAAACCLGSCVQLHVAVSSGCV
ncbi:hypothetical protein ACOSQ2_009547 [Xanthoceras sorbifolium]